jgi:hypothetical protein
VDAHTFAKEAEKVETNICQKADASVSWDRKGVLMVEFMEQMTTVMSEVYCKTLKEFHRAIQNKRRGIPTAGVVLLHDNVRPCTAARTQALL